MLLLPSFRKSSSTRTYFQKKRCRCVVVWYLVQTLNNRRIVSFTRIVRPLFLSFRQPHKEKICTGPLNLMARRRLGVERATLPHDPSKIVATRKLTPVLAVAAVASCIMLQPYYFHQHAYIQLVTICTKCQSLISFMKPKLNWPIPRSECRPWRTWQWAMMPQSMGLKSPDKCSMTVSPWFCYAFEWWNIGSCCVVPAEWVKSAPMRGQNLLEPEPRSKWASSLSHNQLDPSCRYAISDIDNVSDLEWNDHCLKCVERIVLAKSSQSRSQQNLT